MGLLLRWLLSLALLCGAACPAAAGDWEAIVAKARGQTVYFNAWGGNERINAYIAWAGTQLLERYGVTLRQVKLSDTAEAVARVVAEKAAGKDAGGSVDLVWINGENFKAMREQGLLFGPFAQDLPNFRLVDTRGQPTTLIDFTIPTEGFESPWGMAKFVLFFDSARVEDPPESVGALLAWAEANPGRFTYPAPPDFVGSTFLKHVLYASVPDARARKLLDGVCEVLHGDPDTVEMLDDKGQTKLELAVEVAGVEGPAVSFKGSYVVLPNGSFPPVR